MTADYRSTVFLPTTDLPMKAGLAEQEPKWLARWQALDIYGQLRRTRRASEKFVLHDGPPYANGDIHIGHALNKTLKDMIVRSQSMLGKDAPYVPGWDCHGLPIEWKIEEQYRKKGKNKDEVDPVAFRAECRAYAQNWINVQREQFKRLGVIGDWDSPYVTMDYDAEATIVSELLKFAQTEQLYRGAKPVMWSPVEKTALAEAEVEYQDITSTQIDVAFKLTHCPKRPDLVGAHVVIWTTTPWTIPTNRAIAYGADVDYALIEFSLPNGTQQSERFIVAESLLSAFVERTKVVAPKILMHLKGSDLEGAFAAHPLAHFPSPPSPKPSPLGGEGPVDTSPIPSPPGGEGQGEGEKIAFFAEPRPLLPGDFVTTDQGTGLVHMAPDHGEDDFWLCKAHGIDPVFAVQPDGSYRADWPIVGGNHVYKVNAPDGPVCNALREAGALLSATADFHHSYPHSWRSKAKLIFRCTPQWFVAMDKPIGSDQTLRQTALEAIEQTRFVPAQGKNRIKSMVEGRPDWVLSRQRAWGVPITLFVNKQSGDYLRDSDVDARIVEAVRANGVDAWFTTDPQIFLRNLYKADDYERVTDILDVWFDSGSTHAFVMEKRADLGAGTPDLQADLYLEGSDQHRGWFQSSLLESCGTRGRAPYKAVMTHGFTMDGQGRKMSKSLGNTVDPLDVIKVNGSDILRLWVASSDYFEDQRIGKEILTGTVDAYRKLRNTLRYLSGALAGFTDAEKIASAEMPELDRWVLHRVSEMDSLVRAATDDFDFTRIVTALFQFATSDLSAFYFDVRKDSLYCDAPHTPRRRAVRTVMDILFRCLTTWIAPILPFTAEEVWQTRFPSETGSVHLETWPSIPTDWRDAPLAEKWVRLRDLRSVVTGALEIDRREKRIGASLESAPTVFVNDPATLNLLQSVDLAELCITSGIALSTEPPPSQAFRLDAVPDVAVMTVSAEGTKCERCWKVLPEVGSQVDHPSLCIRCADVVRTL
jgi:isoleucyl-tRNA synthetase